VKDFVMGFLSELVMGFLSDLEVDCSYKEFGSSRYFGNR
jgi:hypothetical protein